jgi:DNA-binding MarR family transcriptional regulator
MVKQSSQLPPPPAGVPADPLHSTANQLHSATVRLLRRISAVDAGMDLDGPRAALLSILVFGGPQSMSQLAARERVTAPAITKMVIALEGAGLARRQRSPTDARVVQVEATAAGRAVLEKGRAARVRELAGLIAGLSERDLATLRRAADLIAARLAG